MLVLACGRGWLLIVWWPGIREREKPWAARESYSLQGKAQSDLPSPTRAHVSVRHELANPSFIRPGPHDLVTSQLFHQSAGHRALNTPAFGVFQISTVTIPKTLKTRLIILRSWLDTLRHFQPSSNKHILSDDSGGHCALNCLWDLWYVSQYTGAGKQCQSPYPFTWSQSLKRKEGGLTCLFTVEVPQPGRQGASLLLVSEREGS